MNKLDILLTSDDEEGHGSALTEIVTQVREPPMFQVVLLNDDYTPMDFVIEVLKKYFDKDHTTATEIMLNIHQRGKGICGLYPYDIADTKSAQVMDEARRSNHPLQCTLEQA